MASLVRSGRLRSACWSAFLIPFQFLPYRWLWLPAALATTVLLASRRSTLRELFQRDGTLLCGAAVLPVIREGWDFAWWGPWLALFLFLCGWRTRYHLSGVSRFPFIVFVT
jgi:hypothetical protein